MSEVKSGIFELVPILRYTLQDSERLERPVAPEYPLTIVYNNRELATILCTPEHLDYLTVGFLSSEGFLASKDEIKSLTINEKTGVAHLETVVDKNVNEDILHKRVISTGCGRGAAFYNAADLSERQVLSDTKIAARDVFTLASSFQHSSPTYEKTHGVHSAALCAGNEIVAYAEDIGRHNAVDKILGRCLLEGIAVEGLVLITSGRISSEIVHKAAKKFIPIIVSISVPTTLAVRLAKRVGLTLIGSVRGGKMDVFTHEERVVNSEGWLVL